MASMSMYAARKCWRVDYFIHLKDRRVRKTKYAKVKAEARVLTSQLEQLEQATRRQYAPRPQVENWIEQGWIGGEQAAQVFAGYGEVIEERRRADQGAREADFEQMLAAYEEYSLTTGKGGEDRINVKSHRNNMSMARQVVAWLRDQAPFLVDLTAGNVRLRLDEMRKTGYTEWTVWNYLNKTRLLLDQAVILGMTRHNPAREVSIAPPKAATERRVLNGDEAKHLLGASLSHRKHMSGCLPTVVRLGLYAGLRNQEMCWLRWEAIDWPNRIISIRQSPCEETGRTWVPKDHEMRRLDVKQACIDYLAAERKRQDKEKISAPFVIPGGDQRRAHYRGRPLSETVPQRAFGKMIRAEGLDPAITVYSLRHTYATMALRSGVDLRTLQRRMGHSDIKTEEHPMDKLPY